MKSCEKLKWAPIFNKSGGVEAISKHSPGFKGYIASPSILYTKNLLISEIEWFLSWIGLFILDKSRIDSYTAGRLTSDLRWTICTTKKWSINIKKWNWRTRMVIMLSYLMKLHDNKLLKEPKLYMDWAAGFSPILSTMIILHKILSSDRMETVRFIHHMQLTSWSK